jgi:hypothetical protein
VIAPEMTAGAVTGETAARIGAIPLTPETGARAGALATGALRLAPSLIRGGARLLSPRLVTKETRAATRGAAEAQQASAEAARAGQLATRAPAGEEAQRVVGEIGGRLQATAGEQAAAAQRAQRTLVPKETLKQERELAKAPAQEFDPITGKLVPAR